MPDSDVYICIQNAAMAVGVDVNSIPSDKKPGLFRQAEECLEARRLGGSEHSIAHETECLRSMLRQSVSKL